MKEFNKNEVKFRGPLALLGWGFWES
jgi:hypothetical protein